MQYAPERVRLRLGRSVNEKRSHRQHSTLRDQSVSWLYLCRKLMNSIITQDAFRMRPRQDPQGSIVGGGVVEMNAKCQDLAKHTRWGVRIYHAVLYRPRPPTRRVVAIPKRQGGILMPHHKPVGLGRLVKQRGAEWSRLSTKNLSRYVEQARLTSQSGNGRVSQRVAHASLAAPQRRLIEVINQPLRFMRQEDFRRTPNPCSSIIFSVFIGRLCPYVREAIPQF